MSSTPDYPTSSQGHSSATSSGGARPLDQISVNFINTTGFTETFTITDSNNGGAVVFTGSLDDKAETGFLSLVANGAFGEATYQYIGQLQKPATGTGLLSDKQDFNMF